MCTAAGYFPVVLRPSQCRAARGLLGISQVELSRRSGVPVMVLRRFEGGKTDPRTSTRDKIERALLAAGIQLVENDMVGVVVRETR